MRKQYRWKPQPNATTLWTPPAIISPLRLFFDGCCPGNPGVGSWGVVVREGNEIIHKANGYVDEITTNNVCEWIGCLEALRWLVAYSPSLPSDLYGDSVLVINQLKGKWKCKKDHLMPLVEEGRRLKSQLPNLKVYWLPRHQNCEADAQANIGLMKLRNNRPMTIDQMFEHSLR